MVRGWWIAALCLARTAWADPAPRGAEVGPAIWGVHRVYDSNPSTSVVTLVTKRAGVLFGEDADDFPTMVSFLKGERQFNTDDVNIHAHVLIYALGYEPTNGITAREFTEGTPIFLGGKHYDVGTITGISDSASG